MKRRVTAFAPSAWEAFRERVARLYEQFAPQEEIRRRIVQYVRRWKRWFLSGVQVNHITHSLIRSPNLVRVMESEFALAR